MVKRQVFLLPGGVLPAELAYRSLIDTLGPGVDARTKDLEVYASERPASDFGLDHEVAGLLRMADDVGSETFRAVGYSAGGAAVPAAAATAPERLRSLALLEPAWAGWTDIDPASLRSYGHPVYYALGALSHPHLYAQIADRLGRVFRDFTLEVFDERHHFDPPHRVEPGRLAGSLQSMWSTADERSI